MTETDVKTVVSATVNELLKDNMIKYSDLIIYDRMSVKLRDYYKSSKKDPLITNAIDQLNDHQYIDVLRMYYYEGMTLEEVAEYYDVDISTIVRNKKQLCVKIFNMIN